MYDSFFSNWWVFFYMSFIIEVDHLFMYFLLLTIFFFELFEFSYWKSFTCIHVFACRYYAFVVKLSSQYFLGPFVKWDKLWCLSFQILFSSHLKFLNAKLDIPSYQSGLIRRKQYTGNNLILYLYKAPISRDLERGKKRLLWLYAKKKNFFGELNVPETSHINTDFSPKFDVTKNVRDERYWRTQKMWTLTSLVYILNILLLITNESWVRWKNPKLSLWLCKYKQWRHIGQILSVCN